VVFSIHQTSHFRDKAGQKKDTERKQPSKGRRDLLGHRTKQGEEGLVGTQNQARGTHKPPQRGGEVGGTTGRDLQGHRK